MSLIPWTNTNSCDSAIAAPIMAHSQHGWPEAPVHWQCALAAEMFAGRAMEHAPARAKIPARGGSKGIPRKDLQWIGGKPLVAHTIHEALNARRVYGVVVSTDDPEIADVCEQHGAQVVHRPAQLSGGSASSESALLHALETLHMQERYQPDLLVFLQCTSSLLLTALRTSATRNPWGWHPQIGGPQGLEVTIPSMSLADTKYTGKPGEN